MSKIRWNKTYAFVALGNIKRDDNIAYYEEKNVKYCLREMRLGSHHWFTQASNKWTPQLRLCAHLVWHSSRRRLLIRQFHSPRVCTKENWNFLRTVKSLRHTLEWQGRRPTTQNCKLEMSKSLKLEICNKFSKRLQFHQNLSVTWEIHSWRLDLPLGLSRMTNVRHENRQIWHLDFGVAFTYRFLTECTHRCGRHPVAQASIVNNFAWANLYDSQCREFWF